jgi:hypothetical protein
VYHSWIRNGPVRCGGVFRAPATASRAVFSISARASAAGRNSTARLLIARFTTTPRAAVAISFTCATATWSPVTRRTGTPYQAA